MALQSCLMKYCRFGLLGAAALLVQPVVALAQNVLHVPAEYPTIQAGIDAAQPNDTVLVAEGNYSGPGNVDLDYGGKIITVRGENGLAQINDTEGANTAVRFHSGEPPEAIFEGFQIQFAAGAGIVIEDSSPTIRNCQVTMTGYGDVALSLTDSSSALSDLAIVGYYGSSQITHGMPMLDRVTFTDSDLEIATSSAALTDCTISDHRSETPNVGGGMSINLSTVTLTRCIIRENKSYGNDGYDSFGGGVYATSSTIQFVECATVHNAAYGHFNVHGDGGGVYLRDCDATFTDSVFERNGSNRGGGVFVEGGNASFQDCQFSANNSAYGGGGAYGIGDFTDCLFERNLCYETGGGAFSVQGTYLRCTFRDNTTNSEQYEDYGGGAGLCSRPGPTIVLGSLFAHNASTVTSIDDAIGGGMHAGTMDTIVGCTFVNNFAATQCGGVSFEGPGSTMSNCVLWGNTDNDGLDQIYGSATVTWCDVQEDYAGEGNINADPGFIDPANGDYHLGDASPCIDAGNNDLVPPESDADLDGQPRFVDDLGSPDMGEGVAPLVDMGCYEFQDRSTGLNLRVAASCPDGGPVRLGWANATPNGNAAVLFAQTTGGVHIPNNFPCAGTQLGLGSMGLRFAWRGTNGPDGQRTVNRMASPGACGGYGQFIDIGTCTVSEPIPVD